MSDLEQLAAKGRSKPKKEKRRPPPPVQRVTAFGERGRTKRALVNPSGPAEFIPFGIILVCAGLGAGVGLIGWGSTEVALGLGATAGAIVGFGTAFGLYWTVMFRREVRWLRARPFHFDVDAYLRALGEDRGEETTKVDVTVRFEEPLPEDARKLVRDAGSGMHAKAKAKLVDDDLVVHGRIRTYRENRLGSDSDGDRYPTHEVHTYVRHLLAEGIGTLHARFPVREVIVELS